MSGSRRAAFVGALATALLAIVAAAAAAASAHGDEVIGPTQLWRAWRLDPGIVIPLVLSAWLYMRGVRALHARERRALGEAAADRAATSSIRRGTRGWPGIRRWEAIAFAAGWVALAIALVSPLHPLGETLFAAHMTQHTLLMVIAAPLLVLGRPVVAFLFAIPMRWRRALGRLTRARPLRATWRALTEPVAAFGIQTVALWAWHAPRLYQAALASEAVHALQHLSFLGAALLYWWSLLHLRGREGDGVAALSLFATMVQTGLLGALLTFSITLWYPAYASRAAAWGLTALEDQQLAGLIMWVPAGLVYIAAALAFVARLINESDARAARGVAELRRTSGLQNVAR